MSHPVQSKRKEGTKAFHTSVKISLGLKRKRMKYVFGLVYDASSYDEIFQTKPRQNGMPQSEWTEMNKITSNERTNT